MGHRLSHDLKGYSKAFFAIIRTICKKTDIRTRQLNTIYTFFSKHIKCRDKGNPDVDSNITATAAHP